MKRYFQLFFYICSVLWLCSSCSEEEELLPQGGIRLSLEEVDIKVNSRAVPAELGTFDPEQFQVEIKDESNGNIRYHGGFTEAVINLRPATYTVRAYWGENVLLGLDSPYFEGITSGVKVASKENKTVTVPCKVANALLSVRYVNEPVFEDLYSNYHLTVVNGNHTISIQNVAQSAYFPAGSEISVLFEGVLKKDGRKVQTLLTHPDIPTQVAAGQHIVLSLKASNVQTEISKVEVRQETITATIPVTWLPKPKILSNGFSDNILSFPETESREVKLDFKLSMPLEDIKFDFHFEDEQFLVLNDKTYYLSNTEDKAQIESILNVKLPNVGDATASWDMSTLVDKMRTNAGETTTNSITLDVKANSRWSSEDESLNRVFTFECVKPKFVVSCFPGRIWTREFTINSLSAEDVTSGNLDKLKSDLIYQYSSDSNHWNDYQSPDLRLDNLNSNQVYYVRAVYRGEVYSDVIEVRTREVDRSLDTGFETWSSDNMTYWKRWFLNANKNVTAEGWCSLNTLTTSNESRVAYRSNSGTEPTSDCYTGDYAAEIKTIGWGDRTTAAAPISVIRRNTPGEAFLGKMSGNTPVYGFNNFKSRPTGVRFFYKYQPKGNHTFKVEISLYSNAGEIASNTFDGGATNSYTEKVLTFNYDENFVREEVTGIKIRFFSGENTNAEVDEASVLPGTRHTGNRLYIDDVSLVYYK